MRQREKKALNYHNLGWMNSTVERRNCSKMYNADTFPHAYFNVGTLIECNLHRLLKSKLQPLIYRFILNSNV